MKAIYNGVVIAESDITVMVEGNHYFPPETVRAECLVPSATSATCPWKGQASYYSVNAGGEQLGDAAWYYPRPQPAARHIAGYIAFGEGVTVVGEEGGGGGRVEADRRHSLVRVRPTRHRISGERRDAPRTSSGRRPDQPFSGSAGLSDVSSVERQGGRGMRTFDVIVIGAGPAGEVAAGRLADDGHDVAIVEAELVGGECSFYACMPSKALLRPAEALAEVRRVPGAAEAVTGELDVEAALARRDQIVNDLDDSLQVPWLEAHNVALIRGHGRLEGERRVRVGDELLEARRAVVVAVGSAAAVPPIPGLADAKPWTNREITTTHEIPARLVVLGGGAVGVEMAQAYSTLGSDVTIIEAAERLLPREEPFAGEQARDALVEQGVQVHLGVSARAVSRDGSTVAVELENRVRLEGDELLVAVGRRALTDDLGLESVGLEPGGPIAVDDTLRAPGLPWLYAIGDVNGRSLLTHMGKHQARVASQVIDGGRARVKRDNASAPRVVFTDPQLAAVGLTLQAAREQERAVFAYDVPSSGTAGASFHARNTPGTSRIVVDENRGVIVGATFTGADVADWLHAATIAIVSELPVELLWEAVPAFPTRSEIWLKLLEKRETELAAERRKREPALAA